MTAYYLRVLGNHSPTITVLISVSRVEGAIRQVTEDLKVCVKDKYLYQEFLLSGQD